ncbi:MAG: hypothetical protein OJF60_003263 [Burkholderiaceae bacterium]|jgi:2-methylcitrate dehydratase PrpD|nr:MAG: hypothetical protein OJF60_003263 [Burkholderiaceae bacterium]
MEASRESPPVTEQLSRFAATLRFDDVPADVVERAKLLFMDLAGIMIRSQPLDSTLSLKASLRELGHANGNASVLGSREGWTPQAAALIGGAAAHSLDFDDTHAAAQLHPGAPVIPAALAAAQMAGASTRELLAAIVAGYEVMIRVALGLPTLLHSQRGYHATATTGVFGAAAAAGNVLRLTPEQMAHAFGTALSASAGTGQFVVNGAWTKRFHVGNAAANGLLAAVLARNDYTGAAQAFEGNEGFFRVYSPQPQPEAAVQGLGVQWEIMQSGLKPYPCCRGIHAPLDAVMALHRKHRIDIGAIESVRVGMAGRSVYVVGEPQQRRRNPQNVVDCQFSTHLCLAVALKSGHMGWDDYAPALADPDIRALMQRIDVREDAECEANFPQAFSAVVEIRTTAGETWREFVYQPRGEPATMLSSDELRAKFALLVTPSLGVQGEPALFDAIQRMDRGAPVAELYRHALPLEERTR